MLIPSSALPFRSSPFPCPGASVHIEPTLILCLSVVRNFRTSASRSLHTYSYPLLSYATPPLVIAKLRRFRPRPSPPPPSPFTSNHSLSFPLLSYAMPPQSFSSHYHRRAFLSLLIHGLSCPCFAKPPRSWSQHLLRDSVHFKAPPSQSVPILAFPLHRTPSIAFPLPVASLPCIPFTMPLKSGLRLCNSVHFPHISPQVIALPWPINSNLRLAIAQHLLSAPLHSVAVQFYAMPLPGHSDLCPAPPCHCSAPQSKLCLSCDSLCHSSAIHAGVPLRYSFSIPRNAIALQSRSALSPSFAVFSPLRFALAWPGL